MSVSSWRGRGFLIANSMSFLFILMIVYQTWAADPNALILVKFVSETAPAWLSFFSMLFAAMLVFMGLIYTVQDELFLELLSNKPNLERLAYQAILQLGFACIALIISSQPHQVVYGWRRFSIIIAVLTGVQGIVKVVFVFLHFYSMNYIQERYLRHRKP